MYDRESNIFYGFVVELYIDIGWIRENKKELNERQ